MNPVPCPALPGQVASFHLHPARSGAPLSMVQSVELVVGKGILDEPRYFGRLSHTTGKSSRRQVSLIEREQIASHASSLGLQSIPPGAVRANIETTAIDLIALLGRHIKIGEAVLYLYEARMPCGQMDAICSGLRRLMENNRQGVLAEIIRPGKIQVGDSIHVIETL